MTARWQDCHDWQERWLVGPNPWLEEIGRKLKDEESRFVGYAEIEARTRELGFPMSVRTIRFYVDEGVLPPPKKVGKTPVYAEEWILNVLLAIHLMKSRFARPLVEIRRVVGLLQEDPAHLADKLSVLYEETSREGRLTPFERNGLVDAFFGLLTGRLGEPRPASAIRLLELVEVVARDGRLEGDAWVPPPPAALLASQGAAPAPAAASVPALPAEPGPDALAPLPALPADPVDADGPAPASSARPAAAEAPRTPAGRAAQARVDAPPGAVGVERARAVEETFVARFEQGFERLGRVHCPLDGRAYKAGPRERVLLRRDRASELVDVMKRLRVFDRTLLDQLPLDEAREYQVFQRGLFGRGELKVVVTALCLSPLEALVERRWAAAPLGPLAVERALEGLGLREDAFHYVGLCSTVGWDAAARDRVPTRRNALVCLVESLGGSRWRRSFVQDPRWGGVERVFDPESDREKVERVLGLMREHLKPKGEFLIVRNLEEDQELAPEQVRAALDELLAGDPELELTTVGGREIVKRRRL